MSGGTQLPSDECCWVCLATEAESGETLTRPCACPRSCHLRCLARWQLQSAGKDEENRCRFCHHELPTWHSTLAPDVKPITPVMAIKFEGRTYKLKVKPGPEGLREFQNQVRELLGFDITEDFDVTFECSVNGEKMKLTGLQSYGAATHCAAITAAQREVRPRRAHRSRTGATASNSAAAAAAAAPAQDSAAGSSGPVPMDIAPSTSAPVQGMGRLFNALAPAGPSIQQRPYSSGYSPIVSGSNAIAHGMGPSGLAPLASSSSPTTSSGGMMPMTPRDTSMHRQHSTGSYHPTEAGSESPRMGSDGTSPDALPMESASSTLRHASHSSKAITPAKRTLALVGSILSAIGIRTGLAAGASGNGSDAPTGSSHGNGSNHAASR